MSYQHKKLISTIRQVGSCEELVGPTFKSITDTAEGGLCYGLSCMFVQAFFANAEQVFWTRLHFLCQKRWVLNGVLYSNLGIAIQKAKPLLTGKTMMLSAPLPSTQASLFIDAMIFIENVLLYHGKINYLISTQNAIKASAYIMPQQHYANADEASQGLIKLYGGVDVFTGEKELMQAFDVLFEDIKNLKKRGEFRACLLIHSHNHTISCGLHYSEGNQITLKFFNSSMSEEHAHIFPCLDSSMLSRNGGRWGYPSSCGVSEWTC